MQVCREKKSEESEANHNPETTLRLGRFEWEEIEVLRILMPEIMERVNDLVTKDRRWTLTSELFTKEIRSYWEQANKFLDFLNASIADTRLMRKCTSPSSLSLSILSIPTFISFSSLLFSFLRFHWDSSGVGTIRMNFSDHHLSREFSPGERALLRLCNQLEGGLPNSPPLPLVQPRNWPCFRFS